MTNDQMQELARVGAQARLQAIEEERGAILRAFPALGSRPTSASTNGSPSPARRSRKGMSPAQRRAVGERMKAYWAKRRREKTGMTAQAEAVSDGGGTPPPASKRKGMSPGRKAQAEKMRAYWAARRAQKDGAAAGRGGGRKGRKTGRKK